MLEFLPAFERGDFQSVFDDYMAVGRDPQAVTTFASSVASSGFMLQFNWPDWWRDEGRALVEGDGVRKANLHMLRMVLTTWVRSDRFCGSTLARLCSDGSVLAVLRRLRELVDDPD